MNIQDKLLDLLKYGQVNTTEYLKKLSDLGYIEENIMSQDCANALRMLYKQNRICGTSSFSGDLGALGINLSTQNEILNDADSSIYLVE